MNNNKMIKNRAESLALNVADYNMNVKQRLNVQIQNVKQQLNVIKNMKTYGDMAHHSAALSQVNMILSKISGQDYSRLVKSDTEAYHSSMKEKRILEFQI